MSRASRQSQELHEGNLTTIVPNRYEMSHLTWLSTNLNDQFWVERPFKDVAAGLGICDGKLWHLLCPLGSPAGGERQPVHTGHTEWRGLS